MGSTLKNIVKNGLTMFAVGMLLAVAAPYVASMLGEQVIGQAAMEHALATPVMWTGAFFGTFGAIHAAVAPALEYVFGKEPPPASAAPAQEADKAKSPQMTVVVQQAPQPQAAAKKFLLIRPRPPQHANALLAEHQAAKHAMKAPAP